MSYIDELIDNFNDGEFDNIIQYFGDYETFFNVIKKRNKMSHTVFSTTFYWKRKKKFFKK